MATPNRTRTTPHSLSPEEFDRAARESAAAAGTSLVPAGAAPAALATGTPSGFITKQTDDTFRELASGAYEMAPIFVKIEPGEVISGFLVGQSEVEIQDSATREPKSVSTWILENAERTARVCFLTSYQLDRDLQDFDTATGEVRPKFGRFVKIARQADERVSGRVVSRYLVAFAKQAPTAAAKDSADAT